MVLHPYRCLRYHMDEFQTQFSLPDPMMRLIIPAKLGNDFIKTSVHQNFIQTIVEQKRYESCEDYLSSHDLREELSCKKPVFHGSRACC